MAIKTWTAATLTALGLSSAIVQGVTIDNSTLAEVQYLDTLAGVEATAYFVATLDAGEGLSDATWTVRIIHPICGTFADLVSPNRKLLQSQQQQ